MNKSEQAIAILQEFRDTWRSLGWWAEVDVIETAWGDEYRAALISPSRLQTLRDYDDVDSTTRWHNSFRSRDTLPPEVPEYPSTRLLDGRWFAGSTAVKACGSAIVNARSCYPGEMPTPEQFRNALEIEN